MYSPRFVLLENSLYFLYNSVHSKITEKIQDVNAILKVVLFQEIIYIHKCSVNYECIKLWLFTFWALMYQRVTSFSLTLRKSYILAYN